jgi:hypothetical protein
MCVGIAVLVMRTAEGIKVYAKEGQSSHDELLHEMIPVEQHNDVLKLEYIFPNLLRVDCPDDECKKRFTELGLVESQFGILRLKFDIELEVRKSISPSLFNIKTLQGADLREANLRKADLREADLKGADLMGADLRGANLRGANLIGTNLREADLREADLKGADLRGADLREADLKGADLSGTNLIGADLRDADLNIENQEYAKSKGAIV